MFIVNQDIAAYLNAVLQRGFYDFSQTYKKNKCQFDVHMDPLDFQLALNRAACEMEQAREYAHRMSLSYDRENGGFYCFTQEILCTEREAQDRMFLQHFIKGKKYRIVFVYPEYTQTVEEAPATQRCYNVPHWLSEAVERILCLSLFRFSRKGDSFHVFATPALFSRVMERAYCAATQDDGLKRFSQSEVNRGYSPWEDIDDFVSCDLDDPMHNKEIIVDIDGRELFSLDF